MAVGFSYLPALIIYAVAGFGLSVFAGVLYRVRRAETAGDMIAFGPVRGLCQVFGSLVVSAAGTLLITDTGLFREEIPFGAVVLSALGFAALGWLLAEGVVRKTFRVFRKPVLLRGGILLAVLLLALGIGKTDLFGRVRFVPAPEEVASVTLQYNYGRSVELSPEDAAELHRHILDHRELLTNNDGRYLGHTDVNFYYGLQNGGSLYRKYRIADILDDNYAFQDNAITRELQELLSRPEYCIQTYFDKDAGELRENTVEYGSYQSYAWETDENGNPYILGQEEQRLTAGEAVELYRAILRDTEAGRVVPNGFGKESEVLGVLEFAWYGEPYDGSRFASYQDYERSVREQHARVDVTADMTETVACLERLTKTP